MRLVYNVYYKLLFFEPGTPEQCCAFSSTLSCNFSSKNAVKSNPSTDVVKANSCNT